nr:MAG TPA: hypothetical protein [Caudoviricetes sp.]
MTAWHRLLDGLNVCRHKMLILLLAPYGLKFTPF